MFCCWFTSFTCCFHRKRVSVPKAVGGGGVWLFLGRDELLRGISTSCLAAALGPRNRLELQNSSDSTNSKKTKNAVQICSHTFWTPLAFFLVYGPLKVECVCLNIRVCVCVCVCVCERLRRGPGWTFSRTCKCVFVCAPACLLRVWVAPDERRLFSSRRRFPPEQIKVTLPPTCWLTAGRQTDSRGLTRRRADITAPKLRVFSHLVPFSPSNELRPMTQHFLRICEHNNRTQTPLKHLLKLYCYKCIVTSFACRRFVRCIGGMRALEDQVQGSPQKFLV